MVLTLNRRVVKYYRLTCYYVTKLSTDPKSWRVVKTIEKTVAEHTYMV